MVREMTHDWEVLGLNPRWGDYFSCIIYLYQSLDKNCWKLEPGTDAFDIILQAGGWILRNFWLIKSSSMVWNEMTACQLNDFPIKNYNWNNFKTIWFSLKGSLQQGKCNSILRNSFIILPKNISETSNLSWKVEMSPLGKLNINTLCAFSPLKFKLQKHA